MSAAPSGMVPPVHNTILLYCQNCLKMQPTPPGWNRLDTETQVKHSRAAWDRVEDKPRLINFPPLNCTLLRENFIGKCLYWKLKVRRQSSWSSCQLRRWFGCIVPKFHVHPACDGYLSAMMPSQLQFIYPAALRFCEAQMTWKTPRKTVQNIGKVPDSWRHKHSGAMIRWRGTLVQRWFREWLTRVCMELGCSSKKMCLSACSTRVWRGGKLSWLFRYRMHFVGCFILVIITRVYCPESIGLI
jgi:hypothetical protein